MSKRERLKNIIHASQTENPLFELNFIGASTHTLHLLESDFDWMCILVMLPYFLALLSLVVRTHLHILAIALGL